MNTKVEIKRVAQTLTAVEREDFEVFVATFPEVGSQTAARILQEFDWWIDAGSPMGCPNMTLYAPGR